MLKKKCPAIETVIQYKAGAGGGLMWAQMNTLPADGLNIVGVNLPHIVLQPMEGSVSYKTEDVTPVFWFHYTPDILVVGEQSPIKTWADFVKAAKADPGKINLGGSGLNSANHAAHERMDQAFSIKTTYVPYKGTGDLTLAVLGGHIDGAMTYTPFAIANKGKVRPLAVAMEQRHPLLPDVPTFRSSASTGSTAPTAASACPRPPRPSSAGSLSELFAALNADPEMKELAAKAGFELVNVGIDGMDAYMKARTRVYTDVGKRMGLGGGK